MTVYAGNVPKPEPHFGWVSILHLIAIFVLPALQKGTFNIVGVTSSFIKEFCDYIKMYLGILTVSAKPLASVLIFFINGKYFRFC